MYLTTDIYSTFRHLHLYGHAGDQVEEIGFREDVKIVEGKHGHRFSVRAEFLSETKPVVISKQEAPEPIKQQPVKNRKAATTKPQTLF